MCGGKRFEKKNWDWSRMERLGAPSITLDLPGAGAPQFLIG